MVTEQIYTEYVLFAGCLAKTKIPHLEALTKNLLEKIGISLVDNPDYICCPDPVVFRSSSRTDWVTIAARNLSLDGTRPIVTICPGCASSLSEARLALESDDKLREEVKLRLRNVGLSLRLPQVFHFLKVITNKDYRDRIRSGVTKQLRDLRVACHYGCHLVKPSNAVEFDDPEKPTSMDDLVGILEAQSLDYEDKYLCCGRPSLDEEVSVNILKHKVEKMKDAGAQAICVACPFCFEQFDLGQILLSRRIPDFDPLPVFYVSQLLLLGMGENWDALGFEYHRVKIREDELFG